MYGFSMASDKFHYFDSSVQGHVSPPMREASFGLTHKFAFEHAVFLNWTRSMPRRFELYQ